MSINEKNSQTELNQESDSQAENSADKNLRSRSVTFKKNDQLTLEAKGNVQQETHMDETSEAPRSTSKEEVISEFEWSSDFVLKKRPPPKINIEMPFKFDTPSDSREPSYSALHTLPYNQICRIRYRENVKKYRNQFGQEIVCLQNIQDKAVDAVRIQREFGKTLLKPLPNEDRIVLTNEEKFELDKLLNI